MKRCVAPLHRLREVLQAAEEPAVTCTAHGPHWRSEGSKCYRVWGWSGPPTPSGPSGLHSPRPAPLRPLRALSTAGPCSLRLSGPGGASALVFICNYFGNTLFTCVVGGGGRSG